MVSKIVSRVFMFNEKYTILPENPVKNPLAYPDYVFSKRQAKLPSIL